MYNDLRENPFKIGDIVKHFKRENVEDETSEQQMEELETGLQEVVLEELKDKEYIKEVTVKLN